MTYIVVGKRAKVHRAERVGSVLLTAEGCNIDQTKERVEVDDDTAWVIVQAHPERGCKRCLTS